MTHTKHHSLARLALTTLAAMVAVLVAVPAAAGAQGARPGGVGDSAAGPTNTASPAEKATLDSTPVEQIVRRATPADLPERANPAARGARPSTTAERRVPDGPTLKVEATAGAGGSTAVAGTTAVASGTVSGLWPGTFSSNPNRQVGKLYYDVTPGAGVTWKWCTATVITAANKSTVITAGHCVFSPDPDNNGIVERNGYWHENITFCPGYEYGCKLGSWTYRRASTTSTWAYGLNGRYNYSDDVAVVLLNRDAAGRYVQDVTGSQGVIFNQSTGLTRHAFGYPGYDARFPSYSYNAEDLVYATGRDTNDTVITGTMWMSSTMTGGSSGGPWITSPNSSWYGYVNSVNSHKPWGGPYMNGPYFGAAEAKLYTDWRAA